MASLWFGRNASRVFALTLCAALGLLTRKPDLSASERSEFASRFHFTKYALPEVPGPTKKSIRRVHPRLQRIASWVSSMGAAAALHDLDGDGLPNDVCYVDPRTDQVIVAPVPTTGPRYAPFALTAGALRWNEDTMAPTGCLPGDVN